MKKVRETKYPYHVISTEQSERRDLKKEGTPML